MHPDLPKLSQFYLVAIAITCTVSAVSSSNDTFEIFQEPLGLRICFPDPRVDCRFIRCPMVRCQFVSYAYFEYHYKGLFKKNMDICSESGRDGIYLTHGNEAKSNQHFKFSRSVPGCCGSGKSDGDNCCETIMCNYNPTYETDINGESYFVIHFTLLHIYQSVPIGQCGSTSTGECSCVPIETVHPLLVFDPNGNNSWVTWFSFKYFFFPSHCACHSN